MKDKTEEKRKREKRVTLRRGRGNRRLGAGEMTEWWEKRIKEGKRRKTAAAKKSGKNQKTEGKRSQEIRR